MGKIFNNSVADAKRENTKQGVQRMTAAERDTLARKLEGETYSDNRSEMCKLIARAEVSAAEEIVSVYADYVVKHTFAELHSFQNRYYHFCDNDIVNIDGVLVDVVSFKPVVRCGKRWRFEEEDKALKREAAKVVRRLWLGRQVTDGFTFVPSQAEKNGIKVLEKKPVTDLHSAFMSMQRSVTALDWNRIQQAAKERKEEEERTNKLDTLRTKVLSGKATQEEIIRFATLAK